MTDKLSERIRAQYEEKEWPGIMMLAWADEVAALEQRVERLERAIDEALRYKKRHKGYIFVNRNAWKIVYEALASLEPVSEQVPQRPREAGEQ